MAFEVPSSLRRRGAIAANVNFEHDAPVKISTSNHRSALSAAIRGCRDCEQDFHIRVGRLTDTTQDRTVPRLPALGYPGGEAALVRIDVHHVPDDTDLVRPFLEALTTHGLEVREPDGYPEGVSALAVLITPAMLLGDCPEEARLLAERYDEILPRLAEMFSKRPIRVISRIISTGSSKEEVGRPVICDRSEIPVEHRLS